MSNLLLTLIHVPGLRIIANAISQRHAMAELRSFSNRDLADLGISRGEIRHVVAHGRYIDSKLDGKPLESDSVAGQRSITEAAVASSDDRSENVTFDGQTADANAETSTQLAA